MTNPASPTPQRHSPCIGVCRLDEVSGLCLGCARSGDEIAAWAGMGEAAREMLWAQLPERLEALAVRVRLLPLTGDEIIAWVADSIAARRGTWVVGAPGAAAEFPCLAGHDIELAADASGVTARAADAAMHLAGSDKLRAFALAGNGPTVLGMPKARIAMAQADRLSVLGADDEAIDARHRDETLFDLGVDRRYSRFCVRVGEGVLAAKLRALAGQHWSTMMAQIGSEIIAAGPTRVVESMLARIEVSSPIAAPLGPAASGARARFLPELLAAGEEVQTALALPEYAAPIAVFHPH